MAKSINPSCPCGSGCSYEQCCGAIHSGRREAQTAEQLMRSRYSAFVKNDLDYLVHSWHPSHCPNDLKLEETNWIGLKIKETRLGHKDDEEGWVHFVARYKVNGKAEKIVENSHFSRIDGRWVYVEAQSND
ncbi:MAG: zinc chelation protein SecC [Oleiphilaceae bacterium]|nr:zinc chelation protein SecC [Oleiphilaceae bacterium]